MECLVERLKPEELILAQDLIQQVEKQLGDRHPAVRHLECYLEVRKAGLPVRQRGKVDEDWLWFVHYPFWILARLAESGQVLPACWIRSSELLHLRVSTSDIFSLPPDAMKKEFASVLSSWRRIYPVLAQKRKARLRAPDKLGEGWLGMLKWRVLDEWERELFLSPILPEYRWTPLYRYQDINRVSSILSDDSTAASAFGWRLIRDIRDEAARIRKKYGLVLTKSPRTCRGSKTEDFMHIRREMLRLLKEEGHSIQRVIIEFGQWSSLASEIEEQLQDYAEAGVDESRHMPGLAREFYASTEVIRMVVTLLKRFRAEEIDRNVFGRDERTLRRDWESLNP